MRGLNITNIYIVDGKELSINKLSKKQVEKIDKVVDKVNYNKLRNRILENYGNEITCTIKIYFPSQEMRVYDSNGNEIMQKGL